MIFFFHYRTVVYRERTPTIDTSTSEISPYKVYVPDLRTSNPPYLKRSQRDRRTNLRNRTLHARPHSTVERTLPFRPLPEICPGHVPVYEVTPPMVSPQVLQSDVEGDMFTSDVHYWTTRNHFYLSIYISLYICIIRKLVHIS